MPYPSRYKENKKAVRNAAALFLGAVLCVGFLPPVRVSAESQPLSQEALVSLVKPSVVHVMTHVTGTARIPTVKVDIRKRLVADVPDEYIDVPVDEYLSGSGFIINENGFIATNAHVVSQQTVKMSLASESALSAMFENALYLSDEEMQGFLDDTENNFAKEVLRYVMDHSDFDIKSDIAVIRPDAQGGKPAELIGQGFPSEVTSVNDNFAEDERDVAILHVPEDHLPALALGDPQGVSVGTKVSIFGFPATAELNQNSPAEATFTQGVVSAFRQSGDGSLRVFQTDAKVSQGSSGGPLVNERGEAVGIVTFQTDELNRSSGDNFAFALPVNVLSESASEARITPEEGTYGLNFRKAFQEFLERRCNRAQAFFDRAVQDGNPAFALSGYTDSYREQCAAWQTAGAAQDTLLDQWRFRAREFNTPLLYVIGGSLVFFGLFGAALLWLLRQLRRDEHELGLLEQRLREDEQKIRLYREEQKEGAQSGPVPPEAKPNATSSERKIV